MKIIQYEYTRGYQIKCIFDEFPDTVFLFRRLKEYYFLFSMTGLSETTPERKHYVQMEYYLNKELGTLEAYKNRKIFQKSSSAQCL